MGLSKTYWVLGIGLLGLAGVLSPTGAADALVETGAERREAVVTGFWLLRGLLVFHALAIPGLALWFRRRPGDPGERLVARGLEEPPSLASAESLGMLLVLLVGLMVRLQSLGTGLWFDEIDTLDLYARQPLAQIATTFDSQNQHLFYSLCSHITLGMVSEEAFGLRLPAAIFGMFSLAAVWRFARRLVSPLEAVLCAGLLAVSYHHVWFSQNARGYTGLMLFTVLASTKLLRILGESRARMAPVLIYGACMALAVWTHATAALVVAGHGAVWLGLLVTGRGRDLGARRWTPLCAFVLAGTFSLALYAPVLPQFIDAMTAETMPGQETVWKNPFWLVKETLDVLAAGVPGGWIGLGGGLLVGGLGLACLVRTQPAALALMLSGPVMTATAIVALKHNLWPRFFFFAGGYFALIALVGVRGWIEVLARWLPRGGESGVRTRILAGVGAVLLLGSATTVPRAWVPKQDYGGAADFVDAAHGPRDGVAVIDMAVMPFQKHLARAWVEVDTLQDLLGLEARSETTWLLYTFPTKLAADHPEVWGRVQDHYEEVRVFWGTVRGGEVVVCRLKSPPP